MKACIVFAWEQPLRIARFACSASHADARQMLATTPVRVAVKPGDPVAGRTRVAGRIVERQLELLNAQQSNLPGRQHLPAQDDEQSSGINLSATLADRQAVTPRQLDQPTPEVNGRAGHHAGITVTGHDSDRSRLAVRNGLAGAAYGSADGRGTSSVSVRAPNRPGTSPTARSSVHSVLCSVFHSVAGAQPPAIGGQIASTSPSASARVARASLSR